MKLAFVLCSTQGIYDAYCVQQAFHAARDVRAFQTAPGVWAVGEWTFKRVTNPEVLLGVSAARYILAGGWTKLPKSLQTKFEEAAALAGVKPEYAE